MVRESDSWLQSESPGSEGESSCLRVEPSLFQDSRMNLTSYRLNMGTAPISEEETYFVEVKF